MKLVSLMGAAYRLTNDQYKDVMVNIAAGKHWNLPANKFIGGIEDLTEMTPNTAIGNLHYLQENKK